jgi:hypothetical protein
MGGNRDGPANESDSKRAPESLKGPDVIPFTGGNPEAKVNMEFIRKECEKNKGKNGFSLMLPDGWVGVSDIQIWLKDMGLPFEVSSMDSPSSTLTMGGAIDKALGADGSAGIGNTQDSWKVNFVRV